MQPYIMITNGGDHPADKWADVSAWVISELIGVDPDSSDDTDVERAAKAAKQRAKDRFRVEVADLLADHHRRNQQHEIGKIAALGDERLSHPHSEYDQQEDVVDGIVRLASKAPFGNAFAANRELIATIINKHFTHAKRNVRDWHASREPLAA